ncbi:hypothetical protein GXW83_02610 [Streptacidiphilus sp. PB12-B1b]|uniref:hypothetical protein n=1 Tax=Streptacidiphilus sp. PB12-B1b TaxID=2705012 RepID=UPI0015FB8BE6|nr:hypothetical protein [Streptacidiphilus sp. PB12-B1b]QMU74829.1 hypothetical protein GXW83_02610 [Streptacidiphilus sp. PB12-B1b]
MNRTTSGEEPSARPGRMPLDPFATALASRMPGWSKRLLAFHDSQRQRQLTEQLWDWGTLHYAFTDFVIPEAAVLTGPGGARLVVVHRPLHPGQLLVGALRDPSLADAACDWGDVRSPDGISVGTDPVRAAEDIRSRLLPRYDHAVWRLRLAVATRACEEISEVLNDWDGISDDLTDEQGFPLDDTAYGDRAARRDTDAWAQVETLLTSAPAIVSHLGANLEHAGLASGPNTGDLYRVHLAEGALARAARLQEDFLTTSTAGLPPQAAEQVLYAAREIRHEEGWDTAVTLGAHLPTVLRYAERLPAPAVVRSHTSPGADSTRSRAALSRTTRPGTGPSAAPPPPPGGPSAPPCGRSR